MKIAIMHQQAPPPPTSIGTDGRLQSVSPAPAFGGCVAVEHMQMGRLRGAAEPSEGPAMTKAVIDILGALC